MKMVMDRFTNKGSYENKYLAWGMRNGSDLRVQSRWRGATHATRTWRGRSVAEHGEQAAMTQTDPTCQRSSDLNGI